MSILSDIWNFIVGKSAEKGSVDGSSKHPLDPLAGLEERRVAPVKEEPKPEAPEPKTVVASTKTTTTKKPVAKPKTTATKTTKTKGTGKPNGNVRHKRKDSGVGK
jgi:hypothetical protein